uniref:Sulfate Permease (SulP) Family putative n=1 Tax=Albugo laibachii Nc14 TaxID=890382 RepID=F0WHJ1_9STRA|nr:Sulfate Permease (SulP) Family putative [Albugo laibachii Nc14]|eukprot:CCA20710.1 Sulfate Permease (SulP) Family putative [Albugo laibachii Nc14]
MQRNEPSTQRNAAETHRDEPNCMSCVTAMASLGQDALISLRNCCTMRYFKHVIRHHLPIIEWLPQYDKKEDFQYDLVAGITVGMMIVPEEISLSTMMGVPPIYGLYTAALVPMIYPLFGTSRVLSVANGAEVSLLVGSAIKKIESEDERVATAILLSFLIGFLQLMMGVFRLGILADFFSRPVMGGFVSAGGVLIMLSQAANLMGVTIPSRDLPFLTVLDLFQQSPNINTGAFALGLCSIWILLLLKKMKWRSVVEIRRLEEEIQNLMMESGTQTRSDDTEVTTSEEIDKSTDKELENGCESRRKLALGCQSATASLDHIQLSPTTSGPLTFHVDRSNFGVHDDGRGTCVPHSAISSTLAPSSLASPRFYHSSAADETVGFSLSDEDYLHLEPTEKSSRFTPSYTQEAGENSLGRASKRVIDDSVKDSESEDSIATGHNMARRSSDVSVAFSIDSHTALHKTFTTGRSPFSSSIRGLRSKISVLVAGRLICDLGSFLVCLLGGIIGFFAGEKRLMLTGYVPGGYPGPILPWYGLLNHVIEADRLYHIIIDTLSIALISYMSSVAMAKRLAIKEGYRIRTNQELIALGMANLIGSFFQGMPSTGGLSRTAVNMQNARTQVASLISAVVVVIALYTATGTLAYLPKTSLSAIIIVAGYSLIESKEAKWLFRVKKEEFYVWLASFVLTVLLGVLPGLLSSIFCSLIAVIYKTRRPSVIMLGEIATKTEKEAFELVELDLYPDTAQPLDGLVIFRVEGALYFANCEYIEQVITREIEHRNALKGVIIDARALMDWDSTTMQMMKSVQLDLKSRGIQLAIVNGKKRLQLMLESADFLSEIVLQSARIEFEEAIHAIRALPTRAEGDVHSRRQKAK